MTARRALVLIGGITQELPASDTLVGAQATITATGILKSDGAGNVSGAVAGTDYLAPSAIGTTIDPAGTALAMSIALG